MRPASLFIFGLLVVSLVWVFLKPQIWGPFLYPLRFKGEVAVAAESADLDPNLVASVIFAESGFRIGRVSSQGARGLMQVRDKTARFAASHLGIAYDEKTLDDPGKNIQIGTWYLRYLLDTNGGELERALAAYNAGETVVAEWVRSGIKDIPYPETRAFVEKVERSREKYDTIYGKWYEKY
jgi:soluble lytic murein transglycosylase